MEVARDTGDGLDNIVSHEPKLVSTVENSLWVFYSGNDGHIEHHEESHQSYGNQNKDELKAGYIVLFFSCGRLGLGVLVCVLFWILRYW